MYPTRVVSERKGSVMHTKSLQAICTDRYFPINSRIRSDSTRKQYRFAIENLKEAIGHEPMIVDLTDDNIALMMRLLMDRGLSAKTINGRRHVLHALWNWLARRGHTTIWPTTPALPEPDDTPRAWTEAQVRKLFQAAALQRGMVKGVPRWLYWKVLLSLLWDTSERIGAILGCQWEHVDLEQGWLHIPASVRKGRQKPMSYRLSYETLELLRMMKRYSQKHLVPPIFHASYLWKAFSHVLRLAGLPTGRKDKFHKIRRSVASHFEARGGDSTKLLSHSNRKTTERSYLDPSIAIRQQASDLLFRPDGPPKAA